MKPDQPAPSQDVHLLWSDAHLLGFAPMDRVHEEFHRLVLALLICDDRGTAEASPNLATIKAIQALEAHVVEHFGLEEQWMRDTGFPAHDCHAQEHAAVLASVREVHALLIEGRAPAGLPQRLAEHLLTWFPGHADYLDSALACWMTQRSLGGKPVVLKRSLS